MQSEILIPTHPVMWGYDQKTLPVRYAGGPLLQAGPPPEIAAFVGSSPYKPQVVARFVGGDAAVLSGVMRGADQIRNRPMVVDAPSGKGHVLLFANNPIYRWQTFGEHTMAFNALLFWNDLPGGCAAHQARPLDAAMTFPGTFPQWGRVYFQFLRTTNGADRENSKICAET